MNYGELKTALRSLINRKDITDALAGQFLSMAQVRLERNLRPSFLQRYATFNLNGDANPPGSFTVPTDLLELIAIYTADGGDLRRAAIKDVIAQGTEAGLPRIYLQNHHIVMVRPIPAPTELMYIQYYGSEPSLVADSDENHWTLACPEVLLYGAAIFAAHHYEDERLGAFTEQYAMFVNEVNDQIYREESIGPAQIGYTYTFDDGL